MQAENVNEEHNLGYKKIWGNYPYGNSNQKPKKLNTIISLSKA